MATVAQPQELVIPSENNYQRSHGSIADRFWRSVVKAGINQCWIWKGFRRPNGYGALKINGVHRFAHRVSFVLHGGKLNAGDCVLHRCDNPPCVNPRHLRKGSRVDNRADCVSKRRQSAGRKHYLSKPLPKDVLDAIVAGYSKRQVPLRVFAQQFNLGTSTIHRIVKGKHWQCTS